LIVATTVADWIAFDLETTGLVAEIDRVVEIGAVRFDASGRELGRFARLVNPERPMSPAAEAIHGLSDAHLAGASTARSVLPEFLAFIGDETTPLIAHNAAFDARFLGQELERAGFSTPGHPVIDTLALARRRIPELVNHRLETLASLLNLNPSDQHRALADSLRVKGLWIALEGPSEPSDALVSYPIRGGNDSTPAVPLGWETLVATIARGGQVRMEYTGGTRGDGPRLVTPRAFVHRGGVPYLVAFCHLDAFEKSFRLDRVLRYEVVSDPD
jgi:DNA polymerase III subunit epsilon